MGTKFMKNTQEQQIAEQKHEGLLKSLGFKILSNEELYKTLEYKY